MPSGAGGGARPLHTAPPSPRAGPVVAQWGMPMAMLCFWRLGGGPQRAAARGSSNRVVDDVLAKAAIIVSHVSGRLFERES